MLLVEPHYNNANNAGASVRKDTGGRSANLNSNNQNEFSKNRASRIAKNRFGEPIEIAIKGDLPSNDNNSNLSNNALFQLQQKQNANNNRLSPVSGSTEASPVANKMSFLQNSNPANASNRSSQGSGEPVMVNANTLGVNINAVQAPSAKMNNNHAMQAGFSVGGPTSPLHYGYTNYNETLNQQHDQQTPKGGSSPQDSNDNSRSRGGLIMLPNVDTAKAFGTPKHGAPVNAQANNVDATAPGQSLRDLLAERHEATTDNVPAEDDEVIPGFENRPSRHTIELDDPALLVDLEAGDQSVLEGGDNFHTSFSGATTITVIGEPIEHIDQSKRRETTRMEQMRSLLRVNSGFSNSSERASTQTLKMSAHAAPWPTSATPVSHPQYPLKEFRDKFSTCWRDFTVSGDYQGFTSSILELRCREYHDVMVSLIFRASLDVVNFFALEFAAAKVVLPKLLDDGLISQRELFRGLYRWILDLEDLELDVPHASFEILNLIEHFISTEVMEESIINRLPQELLVRAGAEMTYAKELAEMRHFDDTCHTILSEYFHHQKWDKFESDILELDMPNNHHQLISKALILAMDFHDNERRAIPKIFSALLKKNLVVEEDIQHGVALAIGQVRELIQTDVPYAKRYLTRMLSGCVQEEVISAHLIKKQQLLEYGSTDGIEVFKEVLHRTPEYSRKIWGGNDSGSSGGLESEMDLCITEYFDARDCDEVAKIIGELHFSYENDIQFLKKLILLSMEKKDQEAAVNLMWHMQGTYWEQQDFENALEELRNEEDDLVLDFPHVRGELRKFVSKGLEAGLVSEEFRILDGEYQV